MRTYRVSLYNTHTKKRVIRNISADTMLDAWSEAVALCHGTNWVAKGILPN